MNFGESFVYHENFIAAFLMQQTLSFVTVILENSVYFVGDLLFTEMAGPVLD
jgi:hypothetical protein